MLICPSSLSSTVRPDFTEMTILGATIAAGLAANVWKDTSQLPKATTKIYEPKISPDGTYNNSGDAVWGYIIILYYYYAVLIGSALT